MITDTERLDFLLNNMDGWTIETIDEAINQDKIYSLLRDNEDLREVFELLTACQIVDFVQHILNIARLDGLGNIVICKEDTGEIIARKKDVEKEEEEVVEKVYYHLDDIIRGTDLSVRKFIESSIMTYMRDKYDSVDSICVAALNNGGCRAEVIDSMFLQSMRIRRNHCGTERCRK